jgi:hypothetical protein
MPGLRIRLRRRFRREPDAPPAAAAGPPGLGEPPTPGGADDAELDALRGELVRELDRLAAGSGARRPQ